MGEEMKVWVVDDDQSIRWVLERALGKEGYEVSGFDNASDAMTRLKNDTPDVLITDIRMPGMDGLELLSAVNAERPALPIIVMTAHSDMDSAVSAYQGGAFEYLPKPFDIDEAVELVGRAIDAGREQSGSPGMSEKAGSDIIGESPAMQEVFRAIGRLSRSNITVLINGESGTGKELVARALHRHSMRADKPFIALNMAAIPRDLLESELFGHERGAFTGAQTRRTGRFEQADGGTLFLDEIGDMPAELQTRLLRVLADGEFYRVGGHTATRVDVRIIAATHQDLEARVREGTFREDLFHRLNVIRIHVPPLRERPEDTPVLMSFFLDRAAKELSVEPKKLHPDVATFLGSLRWPGNVRQLENLARWLTVMAPGSEISLGDLPPEVREPEQLETVEEDSWENLLRRWVDRRLARGDEAILNEALPDFERVMIRAALSRTGGRRQDAARLLGWGRNTLTRKINELGLNGGTH